MISFPEFPDGRSPAAFVFVERAVTESNNDALVPYIVRVNWPQLVCWQAEVGAFWFNLAAYPRAELVAPTV